MIPQLLLNKVKNKLKENRFINIVTSFGTEGRRNNPSEEIPPTDQIFPYIVFKGTDIKDLYVISAKAPEIPVVIFLCMNVLH